MGHDSGKFALAVGCKDQAGVNTDIAAGKRKSIDRIVIDEKEIELEIAIMCLGGQFLPDVLNILLDFRIAHDAVGVDQAAVDAATYLQFTVAGQNRVARTADIRQIAVCCWQRGDDQAGHDKGQNQIPQIQADYSGP